MVRVHVPRCMAWLNYDEHSLSTMDNEVGVTSPKSTIQILPSFKEYTPLVTYPKEVEETLGIPMEVEPLDEPQIEDLGLNTSNHDIPLSFREVLIFDEPEPQPNTLPSYPSLDVSLGDKRGPKPPIKPHSPDSFWTKVVGQSGSLGVDFLKLEMIEDDQELEFKEVSFLGRRLNLPVIFDEKKLGRS
nr:hypothetical protein [Tanacetum cinerariifolium]